MTRKQLLVFLGIATVAAGIWWWRRSPWPEHDGKIRQVAELTATGLRRGGEGLVTLQVMGHYAQGEQLRTFALEDLELLRLTLVDGAGKATPIGAKRQSGGVVYSALVRLPDVSDGDYTLHAEYKTGLGKGEVDAPIQLYAPARVHVLTDRPRYQAGNTVQFRALVVRAADLAPIDGRPGRWIVTDPSGEVLLEEKAPAGTFGVVAGTFPLDRAAPSGTWKVRWQSGRDHAEVGFAVAPFTLPRFTVEATAELPFYSANDPETVAKGVPRLRGKVTYASGAPVAGAKLELQWRTLGEWTMPLQWQERLLPKHATAGADGAFELVLPPLPDDLRGVVTLVADLVAIDDAGDRVRGSAQVLLSEDALVVSAVTELGGGLVKGLPNRVYLRATTPDGRVLQGAKLTVRRAWQEDDPGVVAAVDADGVAALQLDPGPPVNVIIPAAPYRPAPAPPLVERDEVEDLIARSDASLEDQLELDRWLPALAPCARWVLEIEQDTEVALRVAASGAIVAAGGAGDPLTRCALGVIRGRRLPAGQDRLYRIPWTFRSPPVPALDVEVETAIDHEDDDEIVAAIEAALATRTADARGCLPSDDDGGELPQALAWRVTAGSRQVTIGEWVRQGGVETSVSEAAQRCAASRLAGVRVALDEPAATDAMGLVRFIVVLQEAFAQDRPQPTTMLGYELIVSADTPGSPATKLRLPPGEVPPLRVRLSPSVARPGDEITAEVIRGPSFGGVLPKEVKLVCAEHELEAELVERTAKLTLPPDVVGWCHLTQADARGLLYVRPTAELAVTVTPSAPQIAPGKKIELAVRTTAKGVGVPAAVGLFGVDESMAQLAPLPGVGELESLAPTVQTAEPAFGQLDAQALTMGRILGDNAAAAVILRVGALPTPAELDAVVDARGQTEFAPDVELVDRFYVVLAEVYARARAWEASAPPDEKMRPATMVKLWNAALDACAKRGERVDDAFGRRLRLRVLPQELLALVDPTVVVTGTRLTEDIENWAAWVAQVRP